MHSRYSSASIHRICHEAGERRKESNSASRRIVPRPPDRQSPSKSKANRLPTSRSLRARTGAIPAALRSAFVMPSVGENARYRRTRANRPVGERPIRRRQLFDQGPDRIDTGPPMIHRHKSRAYVLRRSNKSLRVYRRQRTSGQCADRQPHLHC